MLCFVPAFQNKKSKIFSFLYIHSIILDWKSSTLFRVLTSTKRNDECCEYLQTSERYIEADVQRGEIKYTRIWRSSILTSCEIYERSSKEGCHGEFYYDFLFLSLNLQRQQQMFYGLSHHLSCFQRQCLSAITYKHFFIGVFVIFLTF